MSGSDTKFLRAAVVLMEELNFSRAATKLNIGQSALSKQIGRLHDQLGYELFVRQVEISRPRLRVRYMRPRPSLLGSAKLNELDPELYLRYVLERSADHPVKKLQDLLPWNVAVALPVHLPKA